MIIPIRCFTCGKVVANKWEKYQDLLKQGIPNDIAVNNLGLNKYCCKRMILTHVDMIDILLQYSNNDPNKLSNIQKNDTNFIEYKC